MPTSVPDTSDSNRADTSAVGQSRRAEAALAKGGRVLAGRYVVGKRIGAGGMATIIRARDTRMERDVAIKVLHRHLADDPDITSRFKAEARHAASLSHPNIVAIFDQGQSDLPYIVMELVDGPSLRQVLATHGPMSAAQVLAVVVPLCEALQSAHDHGIVHRDIKPENVLVTADGLPKLADFGIARVMAATSHTATGTLVGSVHYMAPELVGGIEATPASDQYAIGVMVFELLTGRKPLRGDTPMAIALRHASEAIPPPSRYAPEVSERLDIVVARATDRDPRQRFATVQDLATALLQAVPDDPQSVTTTSADGVNHTLILPPDAHETVALSRRAVAERVTTQEALKARRDATRHVPPAPARPRRRGRAMKVIGVMVLLVGLAAAGGYVYWDQVVAPVRTIPELVGTDRATAEQQLTELGLVLQVTGQRNSLEEPADQVVAQTPDPGEARRSGETVGVELSLGPMIVEMPDLTGRVFTELGPELDTNAFAVADPADAFSDTVPAGQVISQTPPPGESVPQGQAVTVVVSLGIEQVAVPGLIGQTRDEAAAAIQAAQLTVGEVEESYSDEVPDAGRVSGQSLEPSATVDKGSVVSLIVSLGPLTVEVPDVRGLEPSEATAGLEALGLTVSEQTETQGRLGPFTVTSVGIVEGTLPERGTAVQRGQDVEIFYFTPAADGGNNGNGNNDDNDDNDES